ncbi:hypothetical protein SRHO_G00094820 [Serrasalmus rhombeus]
MAYGSVSDLSGPSTKWFIHQHTPGCYSSVAISHTHGGGGHGGLLDRGHFLQPGIRSTLTVPKQSCPQWGHRPRLAPGHLHTGIQYRLLFVIDQMVLQECRETSKRTSHGICGGAGTLGRLCGAGAEAGRGCVRRSAAMHRASFQRRPLATLLPHIRQSSGRINSSSHQGQSQHAPAPRCQPQRLTVREKAIHQRGQQMLDPSATAVQSGKEHSPHFENAEMMKLIMLIIVIHHNSSGGGA